MPVTNPFKTISVRELDCHGTAVVTMGFTAVPELLHTPADVVLALDCSASMTGRRMDLMKAGVRTLVDLLCTASGGKAGMSAGNGTRLGLVTCSGSPRTALRLNRSVGPLLQRTDAMTPAGTADYAGALIHAQRLLGPWCSRRRVILLFTGSPQDTGGDPALIAQSCMDSGTELFCIGLGAGLPPLERWVSAPVQQHLFVTERAEALPDLFREAGQQIARAGAIRAVLEETLDPDFELLQIDQADSGTVHLSSPQRFQWLPDPVGVTAQETVRLRYTIRHIGDIGGRKQPSRSLTYRDQAGTRLCFPSPSVRLCGCSSPLFPDSCPPCREIPLRPCQSCKTVDMEDVSLSALGRIVYVNVTLRKVCPGKRIAVAVQLTEQDRCGREAPRGTRIFTVPALEGPDCRDVALKCIRFVVPEELNCGCPCNSLCAPRTFRARVLANYLDTDFICCGGEDSL